MSLYTLVDELTNQPAIEMQSNQFDTLLKLQDAKGQTLAENNEINLANKNTNSRILFIPKEDGVCRIVAASFQQTGRGEYTIIIREYRPATAKKGGDQGQ